MDTFKAICSRRSVRTYTGEGLSHDELEHILIAANAAPVGLGKYEDMHLSIITNAELMRKVDEAGARMFGDPNMRPLHGAPLFILVSTKKPEPLMANVAYSDAAIIVQNMVLEAIDLGVGACHIWGAVAALSNDPEIIKELNLPEGFVPCCGVVLGKTDIAYEVRDVPTDRISQNTIA